MRHAFSLIAALVWPAFAEARITTYVEQKPARPRASVATSPLQFSQFPNRRARGHAYDLYCPHTLEPNPVVVVAPAAEQPLEHAEPISHQLVRAGYIVIAVEPPTHGTYAAVIGEVADEVLRDELIEAREPGCRRTTVRGAWGLQHGADAVLQLARAREAAGAPLAGVVALYPSAVPSSGSTTPVFVISSALPGVANRSTTTMLALTGGEACDLRWHTDPCRDTLNRGQSQTAVDLRSKRQEVAYDRTREFLRAHVGGDSSALAAVAGWQPTLTVGVNPPIDDSMIGRYRLFSLPLLVGGTSQGNNGFVVGVRPELVFAWLGTTSSDPDKTNSRGHGFGGYGELVSANGTTVIGGGLTYVYYADHLALAPSLGAYRRSANEDDVYGISTSLFLGFRARIDWLKVFDAPYGIRIDGRFALDDSQERSVTITAQFDLAIPSVLALAVASLIL
ncbi:MAG: hypothetical protein ACKV2T_02780 [Kofleriaceae bacterium]